MVISYPIVWKAVHKYSNRLDFISVSQTLQTKRAQYGSIAGRELKISACSKNLVTGGEIRVALASLDLINELLVTIGVSDIHEAVLDPDIHVDAEAGDSDGEEREGSGLASVEKRRISIVVREKAQSRNPGTLV